MKRIILALPALLMLAGCFHEDAGKLDSQAEIIPFEIRCISGDVTDLTHESVTFNGWVSVDGFQEGARVEAGFYYSPTEDNLIDLKTKGKYVPAGVLPSSGGGFKAEIIGLEASTRYYYISQAQSSGSQVFGNVRSFTTEDVPKNLCVTGDVLDLSEFSVRLVGHVYPKEDTGAFSYGLEWSCKDNLSDSTRVACSVLDENNTYYATLDTLDTDADYFYRAFVKCGEEYVYGETKSFHTFPVTGSVTTEQVSDITEFKALLNGKMEMETIAQTQRRAWFFLGEDPELTIRDSLAADLSRDGTISFRVDTLSYGKTYYCRAFGAVNYGECFERILSGEIVRFSTTDISPELKTLETEDITEFKATLRGFLAPGNL